MELKEGMYVRTKVGIFKIRKITKDLAYWKHEKRVIELDRNIPKYNYRFLFYKDESIFKGAKFKDNILDLIEVGDYVNGYKVTMLEDEHYDYVTDSVKKIKDKEKIKIILGNEEQFYGVYAKDIKSIVTREQFSAMEYKVGE